MQIARIANDESRPITIACVGDSVTAEFWGYQGNCWVSLLAKETTHRWINYGLVGDTAAGMLSRLDSIILPTHPDMVFLLGGWNDLLLGGNTDNLRSCMHAMVHHCVHEKVIPVVGIPYGLTKVPEQWHPICSKTDIYVEWNRYLKWLRSFCSIFHLRVVDLDVAFQGNSNLLSDGLHPNVAGHKTIATAIRKSGYFRCE